ncbi:hypothetical protein L916_01553 [Phytophthora nicotianae]|uniref:Uncharacterized protein n=1 Tax=Phytophthora nicotianae TaxID=4792 RepID=W2JR43_PHYNI|nr:hypothetical protein L916_01553 [Phytophthora nicotianae]
MKTKFLANWKRIKERKIKQIGELVLITKDKSHTRKLDPPSEGPFEILKINNNGTVGVQRTSYCETINIRRLIPYQAAVEANAVSRTA